MPHLCPIRSCPVRQLAMSPPSSNGILHTCSKHTSTQRRCHQPLIALTLLLSAQLEDSCPILSITFSEPEHCVFRCSTGEARYSLKGFEVRNQRARVCMRARLNTSATCGPGPGIQAVSRAHAACMRRELVPDTCLHGRCMHAWMLHQCMHSACKPSMHRCPIPVCS